MSVDYAALTREWKARIAAQNATLAARVRPLSTMRGPTPANAVLNPNPLPSGIAAGANAALVVAAEQRVGYETLAQQLSSGNPGLPPPGSLEYADFKRRGLL